jgi:2'-5' RNA ligase
VYSLNVPVPGAVARLASDLARELPRARERTRDDHTLVVKRLDAGDADSFHRVAARVREALTDQPPFEVAVTGVERFTDPPTGPAPVVYLAVESPELRRLHERLTEVVDPVSGLEGEAYVPHVTVARGGDSEAAAALADREIDAISWPVEELVFWDAERGVAAGRIALPA